MNKTKKLVFASIITAIIALMSFTPIGYLKIGVVEVTFLTVPVVLGAVILGKWYGAYFGLVFGITSFIQCFGLSPFGAAALEVSLWRTAIMCIVPRLLMGFLTGLLFELISKKDKTKIVSYIITSLAGVILNTVLFTLAFAFLFRNAEILGNSMADRTLWQIVLFIVGTNALIEIGVCAVLSMAISKAVNIFISKERIR